MAPGQFEDLVAGANSNPLESAHGEKRTLVFAKLGVQFFVVMIVVTVSVQFFCSSPGFKNLPAVGRTGRILEHGVSGCGAPSG